MEEDLFWGRRSAAGSAAARNKTDWGVLLVQGVRFEGPILEGRITQREKNKSMANDVEAGPGLLKRGWWIPNNGLMSDFGGVIYGVSAGRPRHAVSDDTRSATWQ